MKDSRIDSAILLRQKGHSIKYIAKKLNAAQSSISLWVRHVVLTEKQHRQLQSNMHSPESVEKRRQSRLKNESAKRMAIVNDAKIMVESLSHRELWLIGVALYWAEGGKTQRLVRFSNGDPKMIQLIIRFFTEVCKVRKTDLRGYIHIHESLDIKRAEEYWQDITGMPKKQFYKTYSKPNKSSKGTRNSLPYGVCDIYAPDYKLFLKIMGWIEGINQTVSNTPGGRERT